MAWLKPGDLSNRFGAAEIQQLETGGASVASAIADAEAECEAWVGRLFALPIVTSGAMLTRIGSDVARYNLWRRSVKEDHHVYIAYRRAISDLEDAAAGRMTLPGVVDAPTGGGTTAAGGWLVKSSERVFTDSLLSQAFSSDAALLP